MFLFSSVPFNIVFGLVREKSNTTSINEMKTAFFNLLAFIPEHCVRYQTQNSRKYKALFMFFYMC